MLRITDDQENSVVNQIQEILEQIRDHNEHKGKNSSLYQQLEDALNEYTKIRNKKNTLGRP